jgi:hypothetical protein
MNQVKCVFCGEKSCIRPRFHSPRGKKFRPGDGFPSQGFRRGEADFEGASGGESSSFWKGRTLPKNTAIFREKYIVHLLLWPSGKENNERKSQGADEGTPQFGTQF